MQNNERRKLNELERLSQVVDEIVSDYMRFARCGNSASEIEQLCRHLNIVEVSAEDIPCDGLLIPNGKDSYVVKLSRNAPDSRQRFSLAHELGHVILQQHGLAAAGLVGRNSGVDSASDEEERFCDAFAAAVLMPKERFCATAGRSPLSLASFRRLAKLFNVSLSAAARRYRELLGAQPFAIVTWRCRAKSLQASVDKVHVNFPDSPVRRGAIHDMCGNSPVRSCFESRERSKGWCWLKSGVSSRRVYADLETPRSRQRTLGLVFHKLPDG